MRITIGEVHNVHPKLGDVYISNYEFLGFTFSINSAPAGVEINGNVYVATLQMALDSKRYYCAMVPASAEVVKVFPI